MTIETRPRVALFALGGTIATAAAPDGRKVPQIGADALLAAVPAARSIATVEVTQFRQLPSAHLTLADLRALAAAIEAAVSGGCVGVVVTQGTDALEEAAFALDLLLDIDAPVVLTGAMRAPHVSGADGAANIVAALRVATGAAFRGLGAVVVMDDAVHAARFVVKANSSQPSAFVSPNAGPIGRVVEDRVLSLVRPIAYAARAFPIVAGVRRVACIPTWLGDDGALIDGAVAQGFDGLVIEGLGGGHVAPPTADAIERAVARMPVLLVSRTGSGAVLRSSYDYVGSESDLARRGVLDGGFLTGPKARILLTLLLEAGVAQGDLPARIAPFALAG